MEQELLTLTEHYSNFKNNTTGITCGAGTAHTYGALLKLQEPYDGFHMWSRNFSPLRSITQTSKEIRRLSHVEQELFTLMEHYSNFKSNTTVITRGAGTSHPYGALLKLQE